MSTDADAWRGVSLTSLRRSLAQLGEAEHGDFAMRVLRLAGVPEDHFDACVQVDTPAGGLYAAYSRHGLTSSLLCAVVAGRSEFEELHWRSTGRRAICTSRVPDGVHAAVRTGRAGLLRVDDTAMAGLDRAVLGVVQVIPRGQLRPLSWVGRDAGVADPGLVLGALERNPLQLLVPCHRVTHDNGQPCDAAYGPAAGQMLRQAEGIGPARIERLVVSRTVYLGNGPSRTFCYPTCTDAGRTAPEDQRPFGSAVQAQRAGYRPCRSCRPVTS
ncbi:MAG TPA: MGMT family protein [Streptosporangiaceae bacterium]